ncbi:MAG: universal stress protein [Rhizomicrobium sp.]|jgi:nucleotide-binding universal stress UspA family protein
MTIAKIIAPLTGAERDRIVLASAFAAAKPFEAHVVALFVRPDPAEAMPFFGEGVSSVIVQEIVNVAREAADKAAELARAALKSSADDSGVTVLESAQPAKGVSASFRDVQGNFSDCIVKAARLSDLVVFGPLSDEDKPGLTEAFEETLIGTGRPILLSAQPPAQGFAERIAVAWDGSASSAHAVTAALPYLAKAAHVDLLSVRSGSVEKTPLTNVCEYLALHRVACTDRAIEAGTKPIGETLLENAVACGAGLFVMGGYGHSRLRQFFAGGVTRHVVSHAKLPLFLVH